MERQKEKKKRLWKCRIIFEQEKNLGVFWTGGRKKWRKNQFLTVGISLDWVQMSCVCACGGGEPAMDLGASSERQ